MLGLFNCVGGRACIAGSKLQLSAVLVSIPLLLGLFKVQLLLL